MNTLITSHSPLTSHDSLLNLIRRRSAVILFALACFAFSQQAKAVGPDTDGIIPGSNNGEGIGVLVSRTGGVWNTGTGFQALSQLTAGNQNTATGLRALFSDTNGGFNTATGVYSLFSNTSGFFNVGTGAYALANNTQGNYNTANGYGALYFNTIGEQNTATGFAALYRNTTGVSNTANGFQALNRNTEGSANTAEGLEALLNNTTGYGNTANGLEALANNTEGSYNTANGYGALFSNTTGNLNTALGVGALFNNSTGDNNTAVGKGALPNNTTGGSNTALGINAGAGVTTADDVICIGADVDGENVSNTCYIGNIFGVTSVGISVLVNSAGKLGTTTSSQRFKDSIKPMDQASEALFALKPVTFRYKKEIDPAGTSQFGLVAEEVEKVSPDLVVRDQEGKPYSVRYDQVNAMLLNEFLKEHKAFVEVHRKVDQLETIIAQQQKGMEVLSAQLKGQAMQIQKVSARVEVGKPAPQMVLNNP